MRILFIAEAVTLAHVARPAVLAQALDSDQYEVHFACDPRFANLFGKFPFSTHQIFSIPTQHFLGALARGKPVYDFETLEAYAKEDDRLFREIKPDLVVGDFRLSLSVSARIAKVPYWTITNAYWSPYARQTWPLPDLPMIEYVGLTLSGCAFRLFLKRAFKKHCESLNKLRTKNKLESLGPDLRRAYTDADVTLYADMPGWVPTFDIPDTHRFLGPVFWAPRMPLPNWWNDVPDDQPVIYVNLGSSGSGKNLKTILARLADLHATIVAAGSESEFSNIRPGRVFVATYLPGDEAAKRSRLVICNGGSMATQQALAHGVPVLGIASNMDQYLNMQSVERLNVGRCLRSMPFEVSALSNATEAILETGNTSCAFASVRRDMLRQDAKLNFRTMLQK